MRPSHPTSWILAALTVTLFTALGVLRHQPGWLRGDEGTYVAMAESLARDGDLTIDDRDAAWARSQPDRPASLILERTPRGIAYSKPILYPLLALPFALVAGGAGLWFFNAAVVVLSLGLAAAALARRERGSAAVPTVVLFACASTVIPYFAWRMTESLQVALAAAGLSLALAAELGPPSGRRDLFSRAVDAPSAPWVGAALLGLLTGLREPNALVAAVPVLAMLAARRWRRAALLLAVTALGYLAVVAATWAMTGAPNPYKAIRATFNATTGYPVESEPLAKSRFDRQENLATSSMEARPAWKPRRSLYASIYFFVGRHSGLFAYFPAVLALLPAAFARSDRVGRAALAGFAGVALFYLVYWPTNYFGGETAIGNRYLLAAYPCLLFAPRRLPSAVARGAAWLAAFALGGSALFAVVRAGDIDPSTQSHTTAGLYRWLPYESVSPDIEGHRDRYWREDFVRFVDPFARVGETSFVLSSGEPAAEIEVATSWSGTPIQLLVQTEVPDATLVASDWRRRDRIALAPLLRGTTALVSWSPSVAWRVHPFWWQPEPAYRARLVRLGLVTASGRPATARLRYLGRRGVPEGDYASRLISLERPGSAVAGGRDELGATMRNRCAWTWSSSDPLPVVLGVRLTPLGGGEVREFRGPLEAPVPPGGRGAGRVVIDWPDRPGVYKLRFDLVVEGVAWFAEHGGEPLADFEITVSPSSAAGAAPPAPNRR